MSSILELRDKIKYYYRKYEFILFPTFKFMLAYLAICCVNGATGYMAKADEVGVVLVASLFCSFMPAGCILFVTAAFSLLHMYALSMEVALVGMGLYLVLLLLFMRFDSRHSLVLVLTAICAAMKIPYIVPILVGLLAAPGAAVSVGCGLVVHSFIRVVSVNAAVINSMGEGEEMAKVRLLIDALLDNKQLLVMVAAFTITIAIVYMLRRLPVDHCWTIAMVAGAIANMVVILVGDLLYDTQVSVFNAFLVSVLALVIAKLTEFMCFCVDYSRTENVQFEDDEYYYYVKAVPKMNVAVQSRTVKKINSQRSMSSQRSAVSARSSQRSVITEHMDVRRTPSQRTAEQRSLNARNTVPGGRSVTIGNYADDVDFEDLD